MKNRKLRVESLEERALLAVTAGMTEQAIALPAPTEAVTWWVATAEDTTGGEDISLRDALSQAKNGDTIKFFSWLSGETITLSGKQLSVPKGVTVDASDLPEGLTINANGKSRVLSVTGGTESVPTVLKGLTITGGKCSGSYCGAGINSSGTVIMINCTVSGNTANGSCDLGGGIYNSGALTMTNCTISGNAISGANTAYAYRGGGIYNSRTLTMTNCIVTENTASKPGGGIYNNGTLTMTNCIVSANSAGTSGGGIYNYAGTLTLANCTIVNNSAKNNGSGIVQDSSVPLTLQNSIVVKNTIYKYNGTITGSNVISTFTGWDSSSDCIYYRSTLPLFTDIEAGNYTLTEGSIAINTGNNDFVSTDKDLAGNPRIIGGIVDIGAYEYVQSERLTAPTIQTGKGGVYVSYGANRHQIIWDAVENASGYELAYLAEGGNTWASIQTAETSALLTGLTYGTEVSYRVRAIGEGLFGNSEWSETKTFNVCPMDINGDGDIAGSDRTIMAISWLAEEGDENYHYYADINGDGEVSNTDRPLIGQNWNKEAGDDDLTYPKPLAADAVFCEFASADLGMESDVF